MTRNAQGDICAVYHRVDHTLVGTYQYDAWGKPLGITPASSSSDPDGILQKNPFRYRGYYYDAETGYYYLRSRYYNPEVRRFLNADTLIAKTGDGIGYNLYAYSGNQPVNYKDESGHVLDTVLDVAAIGIDVADILSNPKNPMAWVSLAADVACAAAPCVSGGGVAVRAASKIDDASDAIRAVNQVDDVSDAAKAANLAGDAIKSGSSSNVYIPMDTDGNPIPLRKQNINGQDIPLPDPNASGPHTVLGGTVSSKTGEIYRQSATFPDGTWPTANGQNVPWSEVHWTDHGTPHHHTNPHQHIFEYNPDKGGWYRNEPTPYYP